MSDEKDSRGFEIVAVDALAGTSSAMVRDGPRMFLVTIEMMSSSEGDVKPRHEHMCMDCLESFAAGASAGLLAELEEQESDAEHRHLADEVPN